MAKTTPTIRLLKDAIRAIEDFGDTDISDEDEAFLAGVLERLNTAVKLREALLAARRAASANASARKNNDSLGALRDALYGSDDPLGALRGPPF